MALEGKSMPQTYKLIVRLCLLISLLLSGCGWTTPKSEGDVTVPLAIDQARIEQKSEPTLTSASQVAQNSDPVYRYNQLLSRDSIRPIYDPIFVTPDEADLDDQELILGVTLDGEAKAYPLLVLNAREMVNDTLAGTPILATW